MSRVSERPAGGMILLAGVFLVAVGCGPSSSTGGKQPPTLNVKGSPEGGQSTSDGTSSSKLKPEEFLNHFLKSLADGTASANALTLNLKKKIARPDFKDEEQQKLGYNPRKVEEFLKKAGSGQPSKPLSLGQAAAGPFFFGDWKSAGGPTESCLIRLVPTNDPPGWQVDWFHRSTAKRPSLDADKSSPELIGATLSAHEFLENLLGGDLTLAEAAMNKSWKGDLAWSATESNKDQGYDSQLLHQKLKGWQNSFTEFTFTKRDLAVGKPANFEGMLLDAVQKNKKAFALKVNKSGSGEWLVEEFKLP